MTLKDILPLAPVEWLTALSNVCDTYAINTPRRIAAWLGQIVHETSELTVLEENLNYSVDTLMKVFPLRFPTAISAGGYANRPEALAYLIYGGRMGNTNPEDGWKFRGRGPLQLTGRDTYSLCGRSLDLPLVDTPDLLLQPVHGAESAGWYWEQHDCNAYADVWDLVTVTRRINGGMEGLQDRRQWSDKILAAMEASNV